MSVFEGEKVGLVGPNGAGKSTIFRMIMKEEQPTGRRVAIEPRAAAGRGLGHAGELADPRR
jgi:ATPase subunit of ABC transporter with duplicated ATPase domains